METQEIRTDCTDIALVPLEDVDRMLKRTALETQTMVVQLPTRYKCRLREIRTKLRGALSLNSLFDVAEVSEKMSCNLLLSVL